MPIVMNITEALSWIAEVFEEPVGNVQPETKREEIEGWDSLGTLTLMARLDEDFEIILPDDDFSELRAVEDILKILKLHGHLE